MTTYEALLGELGKELGLDIAPGSDGIAQIIVENVIVLFKPEANGESVTLFSVVATLPSRSSDDMKKGAAREATIRTALSLNLFGNDTLGGHLGLFVDTLVFSRNLSLAGLSAEALADQLVVFARLADGIADKLKAAPESTEAGPPTSFPIDFIRA